ncbi:TRAP transporter, DctQ-like membrane protein [Sulfitobacter noctilucicola]|uniref:TRAP transporter small permease protein n=1 Tax=Sulfitobacter noctilucicola TaxID=1342301 RepID=A0A7W6M9J5_9RHOB|nr:TRAP transporter small permease [Sulfitobacter noctilucicola]KIN64259.1 TRAP transporter, DctQ-like membrane protein [Sulfitobacter noctilucicola]MBB4174573.1 TRAP-type C4-dicarboxylate transport system permease small subunit [Sulfitobacter noctilucicola]
MDLSHNQPVAGNVRGLGAASAVLSWIACIVLFGMMLVTFADVVGRYVFLSPLPAAYEMISLMMPAIIFCAMPITVLREGHVTVDLLDSFMSRGTARIQGVVVNIVSACALGLLAWRLGVKARDDYVYETITDELLLLIWPVGAAMVVLCAIAALAALANAWAYATNPPLHKAS